jgi:ADP-ribose pyrophosphatase YjhB (NUDIX family)
MKDIIKSAWVLIIKGKKVLLVRHWEKAWHKTWYYWIPAGRFEEWETSIQCATRELQEETGLVWDEDSFVKFPELFIAEIDRKDWKKTFSLEVFLCKKYSWDIKAWEENIPEWINLSKVSELLLLPNMDKVINTWIEISKNIA